VGSTGRTNVKVRTEVESIEVPAQNASAIGLIINELLTNAVKHAYPDGRGGLLTVSAKASGGTAKIEVRDDGPGMPSQSAQSRGLGLTLIGRLSRQVGAKTQWVDGPSGTRASFEFPLERGG
jgi:two-component sensor histidine kinase